MSIYKKFDDTLMYLANKSVEAWNFTTGRGKADLANGMLSVSSILEAPSFYLINKPLIILGLVSLLTNHNKQESNKKLELLEERAKEKGLLLSPELYKFYKSDSFRDGSFGTIMLTNSIIANSIYKDKETMLGCFGVGLAWYISGASNYIMRAENLPPRKNCFKRAYDYIKEKISEPIIIPEPAHVPIPVRYSEECTRLNLNLSLGQIHSKKLEAMI